MYLSGPPLHVITLALADEFRQAIGPEMPISFSAGVDRKNFPNMVACGFVPVTTCTDLLEDWRLRPAAAVSRRLGEGDAGRRRQHDRRLHSRRPRPARRGGRRRAAGRLAQHVDHRRRDRGRRALHVRQEPDGAAADQFAPRAVRLHHLRQVRARSVRTTPTSCTKRRRSICITATSKSAPDGTIAECGDERHFVVERSEQIANFADFCNYCGNCDTFCPEWDGPYLKKPNFFGSRQSFDAAAAARRILPRRRTGTLHAPRPDCRPVLSARENRCGRPL